LTISTQSNNAFPADLLIELDRSRRRGLRTQLEHGLRMAITRGSLPPHTLLPPSRVLAVELDVSRSLVVAAYEQLTVEGYLETRQGSGTRVRAVQPVQAARPAQPAQQARGGWDAVASESAPYWPVPVGPGSRLPRSGLPDPALFPRSQWLRHYRDVLRELPADGLLYPPPRGSRKLRTALAAYLGRVRGVRATPDQIVICGGFSQGLTLMGRVLRQRGVTRIAVEDPCFLFHRMLIRAAGLEPVPVPVDERGMVTRLLTGLDVGAVLLSPAHSYPSGVTLSADRRIELLRWAREAGALVIEDDYDAELRYDRVPVGALQGLDTQRVVYGGTASKVLSPALRLGWLVVPPEMTGEVILARCLEDYSGEALGQLTLARFVDSGGLARHLRRIRPVYRSRRDRLLAALAEHLPGIRPEGEAAGLHLLLRLPTGLDPRVVSAVAEAHSFSLEDAAWHWADPAAAPPVLLIGYGSLRESDLAGGIEALAVSLRELAIF
jgi:GntR family transcriptional regulator / MocR family aminotransferase